MKPETLKQIFEIVIDTGFAIEEKEQRLLTLIQKERNQAVRDYIKWKFESTDWQINEEMSLYKGILSQTKGDKE